MTTCVTRSLPPCPRGEGRLPLLSTTTILVSRPPPASMGHWRAGLLHEVGGAGGSASLQDLALCHPLLDQEVLALMGSERGHLRARAGSVSSLLSGPTPLHHPGLGRTLREGLRMLLNLDCLASLLQCLNVRNQKCDAVIFLIVRTPHP